MDQGLLAPCSASVTRDHRTLNTEVNCSYTSRTINHSGCYAGQTMPEDSEILADERLVRLLLAIAELVPAERRPAALGLSTVIAAHVEESKASARAEAYTAACEELARMIEASAEHDALLAFIPPQLH